MSIGKKHALMSLHLFRCCLVAKSNSSVLEQGYLVQLCTHPETLSFFAIITDRPTLSNEGKRYLHKRYAIYFHVSSIFLQTDRILFTMKAIKTPYHDFITTSTMVEIISLVNIAIDLNSLALIKTLRYSDITDGLLNPSQLARAVDVPLRRAEYLKNNLYVRSLRSFDRFN